MSRVLVTGTTGYIGGRLVPRLLAAGYQVRCLVRTPRKLAGRDWFQDPRIEVVTCDLEDITAGALADVMQGCDAAYYLVHSMVSAGDDYIRKDREIAGRFASASGRAGLKRIVYLGGLGELGPGLSRHLASRREVGEILRSGPVPVTELRAAMIIGSGSASFEILRYLVERLPIMITPRWVQTRSQPIAIEDVLHYLVDTLKTPATARRTLDIGGADVLTYAEIMHIMAEELGLRRRLILPVPVLTPRLSSLWIHLITPLSSRIARPLAEGLRNEVVCRDDEAVRLMPGPRAGVREAVRSALRSVAVRQVETTWSSAGVIPGDPDWAGGKVFRLVRTIEIDAPVEQVFRAVCRVGGGNGWYAADWLWVLRGGLDRLVGGPGLRRGRRDPENVAYGEALDFWRVTELEQDRLLGLRAEMKLPGEALLEFETEILTPNRTRLIQRAFFLPRGLAGLAYWYAILPLHSPLFRSMLTGIKRTAERAPGDGRSGLPSNPV